MALITATDWMALRGEAVEGDDLAAVSAWCDAVSEAVKAMGAKLERATYADRYYDAPCDSPVLLLREWPLVSVTSLYFNPTGYGVPANYTADHLYAEGTEYVVESDDDATGYSRRARVRRLNQDFWGVAWSRGTGWLTSARRPVPKAVKITYVAGYSPVPSDLQGALALAVSLLFNRRRTGMPVASSAWNGRSVSYAGPFTAAGVLHTPDVWAVLSRYVRTLSIA